MNRRPNYVTLSEWAALLVLFAAVAAGFLAGSAWGAESGPSSAGNPVVTTSTSSSTTTSTSSTTTTSTTTTTVAPTTSTTAAGTVNRVAGPSSGGRLLGSFRVTCYGNPLFPAGQVTKSGRPVGPGSIAVDPSVIPLGTYLEVEGYGRGRADDTGSAVHGRHVDVWVSDPSPCPVASPARVWIVG